MLENPHTSPMNTSSYYGEHMRYKIIEIYEEDYGCEGIPENHEPMCNVLVSDELGNKKWIKLSDDFLIKHKLNEGDYLELLD